MAARVPASISVTAVLAVFLASCEDRACFRPFFLNIQSPQNLDASNFPHTPQAVTQHPDAPQVAPPGESRTLGVGAGGLSAGCGLGSLSYGSWVFGILSWVGVIWVPFYGLYLSNLGTMEKKIETTI